MSRIGNAIIEIPKDVTIEQTKEKITVSGPKGALSLVVPPMIAITIEGPVLTVTCKKKGTAFTALHGFVRAEIANYVKGVTTGWTRVLELSGVGYRAVVTGSNLTLSVGFSHPVVIIPPEGITLAVVEGKIVVSGIDKQLVGQVAANIRSVKKPEPYKGKGIKYQGEHIRKKAGKSAKAIGGAAGAK